MSEKNHTKLKNLKIQPEVHDRLKKYCQENGLKMFGFVEKLIRDNCQIVIEKKDIYGE
jgi:macrodomain Ter protein organizer (MatP/YcbG family)